MNIKNLTLLTVSFNNNIMTGLMIKSFFKQLQNDIEVVIVDNGTALQVDENLKSIFNVVDNFQHKLLPDYKQCSKNHCVAIDYALKNIIKTKWVLLVDNDVFFKPSIKDFLEHFAEDSDCVGEVGWDDAPPVRLFPYFCLINVDKFRNEKLNYFDNDRCIGPGSKEVGKRGPGTPCWYKDTGCSFLEDIQNSWKIQEIQLSNYIVHMKCTGQSNRDFRKFLNDNRDLL